jgi:hypothetical protein
MRAKAAVLGQSQFNYQTQPLTRTTNAADLIQLLCGFGKEFRWLGPSRLPRTRGEMCVIYFRVQASSSHTISHAQSHVGAPITGSSTPHRRHPLVMTLLAPGLLKQEIAPYPDEGE